LTISRRAVGCKAFSSGVFDDHDKLVVLVSTSSDVSDSWKREDSEVREFYRATDGNLKRSVPIEMLVAIGHRRPPQSPQGGT